MTFKQTLVGGWTNPFEKYARKIGSSPRVRVKKMFETIQLENLTPKCHFTNMTHLERDSRHLIDDVSFFHLTKITVVVSHVGWLKKKFALQIGTNSTKSHIHLGCFCQHSGPNISNKKVQYFLNNKYSIPNLTLITDFYLYFEKSPTFSDIYLFCPIFIWWFSYFLHPISSRTFLFVNFGIHSHPFSPSPSIHLSIHLSPLRLCAPRPVSRRSKRWDFRRFRLHDSKLPSKVLAKPRIDRWDEEMFSFHQLPWRFFGGGLVVGFWSWVFVCLVVFFALTRGGECECARVGGGEMWW